MNTCTSMKNTQKMPRFKIYRPSNIVMDHIEINCLNKLDVNPLAYYMYVDDIFAIIPRNELNIMLDASNSYDDRLELTHKIEENIGA